MSIFTHPEAAETRLRQGLIYQLQQIKESNGYSEDVGDIFDRLPTLSEIKNWPAIEIHFGEEQVLNEDQSDQQWQMEVPLLLVVHLKTQEDMPLARERVKRDILHRLGNNFTLPGPDGVESCMLISFARSRGFGMILNEPRGGVAMAFNIRYNFDITDPTVAT